MGTVVSIDGDDACPITGRRFQDVLEAHYLGMIDTGDFEAFVNSTPGFRPWFKRKSTRLHRLADRWRSEDEARAVVPFDDGA